MDSCDGFDRVLRIFRGFDTRQHGFLSKELLRNTLRRLYVDESYFDALMQRFGATGNPDQICYEDFLKFLFGRRTDSRVGFVVDCGSGHTAVFRYQLDSSGKLREQMQRCKPAVQLHKILRDGVDGFQELLQSQLWLDIGADLDSDAPIFFGCTGGVRIEIDEGKVSKETLLQVAEALRQRWPGRAQLKVLTGEEEAAMELSAARFLVRRQDCGLLSGGGASCQIALGDSGQRVLSIPASTVEAKRELDRDGFDASWAPWLVRLAQQLRDVPDVPVQGFSGVFVCTEMQCTCAHQHGGLPKDRLLSQANVLMSLDELMDAWVNPVGPGQERIASIYEAARAGNAYGQWTEDNAAERWTYYRHIWMPAAARLRAIVQQLFAPDASFIFISDVELAPGQRVKAKWSLGYFLTTPL